MFEKLDMAPADAILGLTEAFKKDPNPAKINLSVGVYKDANGKTPVLATVKDAEKRILESETTKGYLPIDGGPEYAAAVQSLVLGDAAGVGGAATAHTPGGTGALRVAGDLIAKKFTGATVWMSDPTWPNHPSIFAAAGVKTKSYPYYDPETKDMMFEAMAEVLRQVPAGDFVLLHGCCHNPTGIDPTPAQWQTLAEIAVQAGWVPLVDFAYQGLAAGIEEDAVGVRTLARAGCEMLVCSSFSKNFGLYNERVGALTVVAKSQDAADKTMSHIKACVRANYSNPPSHGASIVTTIVNDDALRARWENEVKDMRDRINGMRRLFVDTLRAKGVDRDFSFIARQTGMFSFSGLNKEQVERLKKDYAIYIVGSGRINVAGMTEGNMDALCTAIAEVLKG